MWHLSKFLTNIYWHTHVRASYPYIHTIDQFIHSTNKFFNVKSIEKNLDYSYSETGKNGTIRQDEALLRQHAEREQLTLSFSDQHQNCDYNYVIVSAQFR